MHSEKNLHVGQTVDSRLLIDDDNAELEIDLVELMYRMIEKIKWIIAAALIGMVFAGVFTKFFVTPQYEATTKLYVQEAEGQIVDLSAINLSQKLAADYLQVFNNWEVHEKVIAYLDLPYSYRQIQRMLTIDIIDDTRIISITVTNPDPEEAYKIADAYAKCASSFIVDRMLTSEPPVFEHARIPTSPSSPNTKLNVMLGTFFGGAVAVAIIFIQFVSDDRVRNAEMLQKRLGMATLGMMPVQEGAGHNDSHTHKHSGKGAKKA